MEDVHSGQRNRRVRNLLLQPLLQVKLGLYSILLALLFVVVFTSVLIFSFRRLFELILDLTDLRHEVMEVINSYMLELSGKLLLVVLVYFVFNVVISIVFTHRLVGPTVAFRRHIRALSEGLYNSRITLRKNDAFSEVAEDLNHLAEVLEKKGS